MFQRLVACVPATGVKQMLLTENTQVLRPVEFAVQQGTLRIAMCICNIPAIYLRFSKSLAGRQFRLYDVTDYESGERINKSPVLALTKFDEQQLRNPFCNSMIQHPWINALLQVKAKTNFIFLLLCFLSKFIYFGSFMMLQITLIKNSLHVENSTDDCTNYVFQFAHDINLNETILAQTLLLIALIYTVFDVIEFARVLLPQNQIFMYNLSGRKCIIANNWYYGISIFLANTCVITGCIIFLLDTNSTGSNLIRLAAPPLMFNSMMYYMQVVPVLGFYIIAIQRMVMSMLVFVVLLFCLMAPFVLSFIMLLATGMESQCPPGFTELLESYYSMTALMLGLRNFDKYDMVNNEEWLWILHVIYMFAAAILLLNFLIATIADQMGFVRQNKEVIQTIQTMSMFVQVEQQWRWIMKRYYDWARRKYFIYEDGKIYLACVVYTDNALGKTQGELELDSKQTYIRP